MNSANRSNTLVDKRWFAIIVVAVVLGMAQPGWARSWRPGQLPNGFNFACANCHVDPNGAGPRNLFGQAVEAELTRLYGDATNNLSPFWSATLATIDSDGDGLTNGQELGDPAGAWKVGDPAPPGLVSNPGDPNSPPPHINVPPSVTLTAPGNGVTFTNPASVTFQAQATDSDGTVARVDFFDGASLLGSDNSSPYSVTSTLSLLGLHSLTAVAFDNLGASSTSALVTVTVVRSGNAGPGVTETFNFANLHKPVPDGNAAGMSDRQTLSSAITQITAVQVKLHLVGEFNGDLFAYVRHVQNNVTNFCVLLNRTGRASNSPHGYSDAGLVVTFDDGASDVHNYRSLLTPASGTPLTGIWRPDGRAVDPDLVLDTSSSTTTLTSFNGAAASGEWTLYLADIDSGATNELSDWGLQITGRTAPVLAWANPADVVYGTALGPAQLNASASVPGTYAYTPASGTVLSAGQARTLSVTFTPADTNTFTPVTRTVRLNVLQRPLTITALNASKVFGAALPALSATYNGFVNGDTAASLATPATIATTATAASPVGTYPITVAGAAHPNYSITFVNGTLTVTPVAVSGIVSSSANPALPGQLVTFTFQATPISSGAPTPIGTVQFRVDGASAGPPVNLTGGVATLSLATLSHARHSITAEYPGNGNFLGTTNVLGSAQLINTPPVAGSDTIKRSLVGGSKVLLSTLLSNDLDADGDQLQIVSLGSASANAGTIVRDGEWVFYTPPAGFTNQDSFTYTIADSFGSQSSGTVLIVPIVDTVPAPNLQIVDLGNGTFLLRFDGVPFKTYRIEYTVDATLQTGWQPLGSGAAGPFGTFVFLDAPPATTPQRFYRSVFP